MQLEEHMIPLILKGQIKTDITSYIENERQSSERSYLDIIEVIPEKKSLSIEEVRNLRKLLHIKQPKARIVLFWDFDTATTEAQNALLKVLEDKNEEYLFVMQVSRVDSLLSTILSRARVVEVGKVNDVSVRQEVERLVKEINEDMTLRSFADPVFQPKTREDAAALFGEIILVLRQMMKENASKYAPLLKKTLDLLYKLEVYNLNPQLVVDQWILFAKRT